MFILYSLEFADLMDACLSAVDLIAFELDLIGDVHWCDLVLGVVRSDFKFICFLVDFA